MILKEKERSVIEDLQTQEKSCVEKYGKYAEQARDHPVPLCKQKVSVNLRKFTLLD